MRVKLGSILLLTCVLTACGGTPIEPTDIVPAGVWGSDQLLLTVSATSASIESGCDSGRIEGSITPDRSGRFSVSGTYAFGRGGPIQQGDPPPRAHTARYDGTIRDQAMQLTISLPELSRMLGPFELSFGRQNLRDRCL